MDQIKGIISSVDSLARWSVNTLCLRHVSSDSIQHRFHSRSRVSDVFGFRQGASCSGLVRIAGLSGAAAVAFAAYGAHVVKEAGDIGERRKRSLENGNKQHFIHTIGLLFSFKTRFPVLTATLFTTGIICFCGPCYAYAIWNDERWRRITPTGGVLFILGWLSFVL